MALRRITDAELKGKGNVGKPDIPGVSTAEMQRIMDEIPREIIVPAFNELSKQAETALNDRYTKEETNSAINQRVIDIGTGDMAKGVYDPNNAGIDVTVQEYACTKTGKVYALTGSGAVGRFKVPAAWASGDTWTVNGKTVPAYCGADAVDGDAVVAGRWVIFTFDGTQLNFNGGGGLTTSKLAQATAGTGDVLNGVPFYSGNKTLKKGTLTLSGNMTAGDLLAGKTGYSTNAKSKITGTLALSGNMTAADLLAGKTGYSNNAKSKITGAMVNRGNWGTTINPGESVIVPRGYHNGNGKVYGGISWQFVWGFIWHSNRNYYTFGTNSLFGAASGSTWTCKKAGNYRIRAVYSDSTGSSGTGVKKNGSWLFNGMFGDKTQDVSLAVGDTIQIVGGGIYGDPYPACVATIVIWAI